MKRRDRGAQRFAARLTMGLLTLMFFATGSAAQVRLGFSAGGGPSFPVGSLGDHAATGFHVQASAGFMATRVGVRIDGLYQRFTDDDGRWSRDAGLLGNLVFPFSRAGAYLIAGFGTVDVKTEVPPVSDPAAAISTDPLDSFALGVGTRLGPFSLETRFFDIEREHQLIAVTFALALR